MMRSHLLSSSLGLILVMGACKSDNEMGADPSVTSQGGGGASGAGGEAGTGKADPCPVGRGPAMVGIELSDRPRFCIDTTEVTQGQYASFLADTSIEPAKQSREVCRLRNGSFAPPIETDQSRGCTAGFFDPEKHGEMAMGCVDFCDAVAFCEWSGKRLCGAVDGGPMPLADGPSSPRSQWYLACSQGGAVKYPYGNEPQPGKCDSAGGTKPPVPPSQSECSGDQAPFDQLRDLAGGVAEWEDACQDEAFCRVRGGASGATEQAELACAVDTQTGAHGSSSINPTVGFRCCADVARD